MPDRSTIRERRGLQWQRIRAMADECRRLHNRIEAIRLGREPRRAERATNTTIHERALTQYRDQLRAEYCALAADGDESANRIGPAELSR